MTVFTLLNGVRLVVVGFEASEHVASIVVKGDDGLISLLVVVKITVWFNFVFELQVDSNDGNVILQDFRIYLHIQTS